MKNENEDPTLEERLNGEIACLKSALLRLVALQDDPDYRWLYESYEKTIVRREALLRDLTHMEPAAQEAKN